MSGISRSSPNHRALKYSLWAIMAMATISVVFYSEIPLLHQAQERARLHDLRWILIPHAVAATVAFLCGPFQFSSRLRRRYPRSHRRLGRLYVGSVFIAAPLAISSTASHHYPKAIYFIVATTIQGGAWAITTGIAFAAAMNRRIAQHREWMIRSYAVTFTFVGTRVLQPIPAWNPSGALWICNGDCLHHFSGAIGSTDRATVATGIRRGACLTRSRFIQLNGQIFGKAEARASLPVDGLC